MRKLIIAAIMLFSLSASIQAQSVVREGNTFTQVSNKKASTKDEGTATKYQYVDSKGKVYTVMLSSTGKAFVWKTSQKTGRAYKQYLPEIGKQINPKAYKEKSEK